MGIEAASFACRSKADDVKHGTKRYGVFGATGNCGTAILQHLFKIPNVEINAYCRNKQKLIALSPQVVDDKKVKIFEGSIKDVDLLVRCVRGCQTVFLLASTNDNVPGCRISQDLALSIVTALKKCKAEDVDYQPPKLVLLSSATIDDYLSRKIPYFRPIMLRAASNIYEDLRRTEAFLRSQEDWLTTIYIKPGGLSCDIQRGHKLSLHEEETFLSYMDLAAGMLEAANDTTGQWDGKNVGVINAGQKAKFARGTPECIFWGLVHMLSDPNKPQTKRYLSITILGFRNPSLSEKEYVEHMTKITAPLNKHLMVKCGVKRWTQIHCTEETRALTKELFDSQMANVVDYDCFSQVVFHSLEDYKKIKKDPWYKEMLVPDHEKFADTKRTK
ncbi:hypothetical protein DV737_g5766, partial [Chaetothyriales sp. CBS 132003]